MSTVRESLAKASAAAGASSKKSEKPYTYDYSALQNLKKILERDFVKHPEATVQMIKDAYSHKPAETYGSRREFVSDWLAKNGFSDADAVEMRRRLNAHEAARGGSQDWKSVL
jgi:hypothetical protein